MLSKLADEVNVINASENELWGKNRSCDLKIKPISKMKSVPNPEKEVLLLTNWYKKQRWHLEHGFVRPGGLCSEEL